MPTLRRTFHRSRPVIRADEKPLTLTSPLVG
jgi:hypothetical protein